MLYTKQEFSNDMFKNPPTEMRGVPFWAWNSSLSHEELGQQIEIFHEMGFGGFIMHVRQGLTETYLGDTFMEAVRFCVEKAKNLGMRAWLYDEDRWPSGCAGGEVTKEIKHRQKHLLMTTKLLENATENRELAYEEGLPYFVAAYDITVDDRGCLADYTAAPHEKGGDNRRFFYCMTNPGGKMRFNGQEYVDTLSKPAMDKFREVTYEAYQRVVGEDFGGAVPAIFTDEPQMSVVEPLNNGFSKEWASVPWTLDLEDTYFNAFGERIADRLPEVFFADSDGRGERTRYRYFRHVSERFHEAFADNLGSWCEQNGILFTGHFVGEDTLEEASRTVADIMRGYIHMGLPGMDVLFDDRVFTTAKQCASVVHQTGREGMLSEMYGVTGWDFDFRGHRFQGDWQACLGVTVRVPHLAWQTMKGEGKRDYPASIFYQSPWYREYRLVEDHYARLNTVLTRGRPVVDVAVLHPMESYWLCRASKNETTVRREEAEQHFADVSNWLLSGTIDYDYLSESLLPKLCPVGGAPLRVGEMQYKTVILSDCETLREHTLTLLEEFSASGGQLIIMGRAPRLIEGEERGVDRLNALIGSAVRISHSRYELLESLEPVRQIGMRTVSLSGLPRIVEPPCETLMYAMREEGDARYLFLTHLEKNERVGTILRQELEVTVKGQYIPTILDTESGEEKAVSYEISEGKTIIRTVIYEHDSPLFRLKKTDEQLSIKVEEDKRECRELVSPMCASYSLEEPNVLLLDMAEYSLDGGEWQTAEEIMRIDEAVRKSLDLPLRRTKFYQPWAVATAPEDHVVSLRYTIHSEIDCAAKLAMENLTKATVFFNGQAVASTPDGWWVDRDIETVALPMLHQGDNVLEITMPFGLRTDLEACYLLGDFGTAAVGSHAYITTRPEKLWFGSVTEQGMKFYGGNVRYENEVVLPGDGDLEIEVSFWRGAFVKVFVDGREAGDIIKSPYRVTVRNLSAGKHNVTYVLYGTRYNTFSALHNLSADNKRIYIGPDFWRSSGEAWSYGYFTRPMGILKEPVLKWIEKK